MQKMPDHLLPNDLSSVYDNRMFCTHGRGMCCTRFSFGRVLIECPFVERRGGGLGRLVVTCGMIDDDDCCNCSRRWRKKRG